MEKIELYDQEAEAVSGGKITYTWDGKTGTIGINGNNAFILVSKEAFVNYYKSVQGTMKDSEVLNNLLSQGVIKKK